MARESFGSKALHWVQCIQPSGHVLRGGDEASRNQEFVTTSKSEFTSPHTVSLATILWSEPRHDGLYTSGAEQTAQTRESDGSVSSRLECESHVSRQ